MKNRFKISNDEIKELLGVPTPDFPKYSTQFINLANQNAQATRPRVVGQMSELIQEFSGQTIEEWERWYLERYPDAIEKATEKILGMVENFREVMPQIDKQLIQTWVRDLIIVKTFIGLRFQEAILKKVSEMLGTSYRLAEPNEESTGIDGYIGNLPVSIKPDTYRTKNSLRGTIKAGIITYKKARDGITVEFDEILEKLNEQ